MSVTITGNQTSTLVVNMSSQNWIVDEGGSIKVTNGHGIANYEVFDHSLVIVSGDIVADGTSKSGIYSEGTHASLTLDSTGSIHAYNGMSVYGNDTYAENIGTITAANIGMYANTDRVEIRNEGSITAKTGIYLDSTALGLATVTNAGLISGDNGIVSKRSTAGITIEAGGKIDAKLVGVELGGSSSSSFHSVLNEGVIESGVIAIKGGVGKDYIVNHGTIKGVISLGDGDDSFDNRGGTIDHAVDGGEGDDVYIFGAKPFTIVDSGGRDSIGTEITRTLMDFPAIEGLLLYGTGKIDGTGNGLANYIGGNDNDNVLDGGLDKAFDTLFGGAGNDTYVLRDSNDQVVEPDNTPNVNENVNEIQEMAGIGGGAGGVGGVEYANEIEDMGNKTDGDIDTITSTITRYLIDYSSIENLTLVGNGNTNGSGNEKANVITGSDGSNILDGGVEDTDVIDTLIGGKGNDTYVLGAGHDKVVDSAGIDTITSTITRSLASYPTIENLTLLGDESVNGTGNALVNVITGNDGNNILDGGIDTVVDTVNGGAGNDTYVLGAGNDKVVETTGTDTITSTITRSLAGYANVENLTLNGTADINGTGNTLANVITGNAGKNILDGGADSIVDTLNGGAGNDTYVLGSGNDKVVDSAGTDMITSSISRSLASFATIENLTLTGTANINATGNALNNVLTGNSGVNTLDGGAGNDTYVLDSGVDKVIDSAGTDTITSMISRNLTMFATIENLKLLGSSNIDGIGNALANTLTGNSGTNALSGGAGNDTLIGGAGADKLDGGANTDTASYAGASAGVVANLGKASVNTGDAKGDTYVSIENLTGSSHGDGLTGNDGANIIFGGAGADKLTGGLGADTFLFKSAAEAGMAMGEQELIFDFSHSQGDKIGLSGIDANTTASGDQAFLFKGTAAFDGGKGEVRYEKQASDTYIYGDINGDKVADFVIHLDTAVTLQSGDFLF